MAPQDADHALPRATAWTVFFHRLDEILAAGWFETAAAAQQWAEDNLISANGRDKRPTERVSEHGEHGG